MALESIFFFPFFGFGFVLYFLPWIIALIRGKRDTLGIFLLNFFLGWTFIGWVVCLIWALSDSRTTVIVNNNGPAYQPNNDPAYSPNPGPAYQPEYRTEYRPADQQTTRQTNPTWRPSNPKASSSQEKIDQLRQLKQLFDEGVLTEEEFNRQKATILG